MKGRHDRSCSLRVVPWVLNIGPLPLSLKGPEVWALGLYKV